MRTRKEIQMPSMFDYFCKIISTLVAEESIRNHAFEQMNEGGKEGSYAVECTIAKKKYTITIKEEDSE